MSDRKNKRKSNVTYLHKRNTNENQKKKNNTRKKMVKKRKLDTKKLSILLIGIFILGFATFKITTQVGSLAKNIMSKNAEKVEDKKPEASEQFDLKEEGTNASKKYTVFIDPGHGGEDTGNQGSTTKKYEKDITLELGKKLATKLSAQEDINVIIARSEDRNLGVSERLDQAISQKADILVSLHLNAEGSGNTAHGIETFYKQSEVHNARELASIVQKSITSYVDIRDRGVGMGEFGILREAPMAAIMIKCGFITTPEEEKKLTNEKFVDQFAEGIAQGIFSYIDAHK
ncbi:MAG: N-acetylmuramoyl-L-alanine amidase [Peptostreptococcaceae bacterium]